MSRTDVTCIFLWLYRPRPTVFHYYMFTESIVENKNCEFKYFNRFCTTVWKTESGFSFKKSGYSGGLLWRNWKHLYIDFSHAVISNLTYSTNSITSYLSTYLNHSLRRMFNSVHSIGHFMRLLMAPRPSLLLYPISILENRMEASQDSNTANNPMSPPSDVRPIRCPHSNNPMSPLYSPCSKNLYTQEDYWDKIGTLITSVLDMQRFPNLV